VTLKRQKGDKWENGKLNTGRKGRNERKNVQSLGLLRQWQLMPQKKKEKEKLRKGMIKNDS
jgi:hypothetical protein